jgi:transketolase
MTRHRHHRSAHSGKVLEALRSVLPELVGGSADLSASNKTKGENTVAFTRDNRGGNYLHYGVREHGEPAGASPPSSTLRGLYTRVSGRRDRRP